MPIAKWLQNQDSPKNRKRRSKNQEQRLARRTSLAVSPGIVKGRVQAGSGSLWGNKGDVRTEFQLIEAKRTDKGQITIKQEWLTKIKLEAIKDGRIPVLAIELGKKRYYIIEECYI